MSCRSCYASGRFKAIVCCVLVYQSCVGLGRDLTRTVRLTYERRVFLLTESLTLFTYLHFFTKRIATRPIFAIYPISRVRAYHGGTSSYTFTCVRVMCIYIYIYVMFFFLSIHIKKRYRQFHLSLRSFSRITLRYFIYIYH